MFSHINVTKVKNKISCEFYHVVIQDCQSCFCRFMKTAKSAISIDVLGVNVWTQQAAWSQDQVTYTSNLAIKLKQEHALTKNVSVFSCGVNLSRMYRWSCQYNYFIVMYKIQIKCSITVVVMIFCGCCVVFSFALILKMDKGSFLYIHVDEKHTFLF